MNIKQTIYTISSTKGFEPIPAVLETATLPLSYALTHWFSPLKLSEKGLEPLTPCL